VNRDELQRRLDEAGIRKDVYQFGDGLPNERLVLAQEGDQWVVYYSERGERTGLRRFADGAEANDYFFRTLDRMPEAHEPA
jgi:hypothetical protein